MALSRYTRYLIVLLLFSTISILHQGFVEYEGPNNTEEETMASFSSLPPLKHYHGSYQEKEEPSQCLSFNRDTKALIEKSKQIFIITPARAAGTSMKIFTKECMHLQNSNYTFDGNFIHQKAKVHNNLKKSYDLPPIISNHIQTTSSSRRRRYKPFISLINGVSDNSLIILMYRQETDRLISAIKEVGVSSCGTRGGAPGSILTKDGECIMVEDGLIKIIQERKYEIGMGIHDVLSCDTYDAIQDSKPNLIVMNYEKADQLQVLLAQKHCSELLPKLPLHEKKGREKKSALIKLSSRKRKRIKIDDWLMKKKELIELTLGLHKKVSCRGKTRMLEHKLMDCKDETIQISNSINILNYTMVT